MFVEHKEAGEVTEAPAKTLKLSEAIRIGARMAGPYMGDYFDEAGNACALGAAVLATVGKKHFESWGGREAYNFFRKEFGVDGFVLGSVASKNDSGRYSREQIADWLESQGY